MICILDLQMLQKKRQRLSCCIFVARVFTPFGPCEWAYAGQILSYAIHQNCQCIAKPSECTEKHAPKNNQKWLKNTPNISKQTQNRSNALKSRKASVYIRVIVFQNISKPCLSSLDCFTKTWKQFLFWGCHPYLKNVWTCYKNNQKNKCKCARK